MSVLIAVASRHGSTFEIGEVIGRELRHRGLEVDLVRLGDRPDEAQDSDPTGYDAVVLGSAVYAGRWLAAADRFVISHSAELNDRPVWVFTTGPVGSRPSPHEGAPESFGVIGPVHPVEHRIFAGKLDHRSLGLGERILVGVMRAHDADERDWIEISSWAGQIATSLLAGKAGPAAAAGPGAKVPSPGRPRTLPAAPGRDIRVRGN
jgi:menaquinone-dependent protoporphyrinogen oxidase